MMILQGKEIISKEILVPTATYTMRKNIQRKKKRIRHQTREADIPLPTFKEAY